MFRRRQAKTHRVQMREELGQSFDHFRQAASHAASGTANLIGPRYESARKSVKKSVKKSAGPSVRKANRATAAAIMPFAIAVGRSARKGKATVLREQQSTRRWPMVLGGLLAAGAAVGAAGAMIARRRANRDQWEEYGSTRSTGKGRTDSMIETAKSTLDTGRDKVQSLAESAKERAAEMTNSSRSSSSPSAPSASSSAPSSSPSSSPEFGSREDIYGKAGSNSTRP
jgi:hypothetical protein